MANLKDIASAIAIIGMTDHGPLKRACEEEAERQRIQADPFAGIMDGPEMMGLEVADSRVMNPDQHAKRIGDLP